MGSSHFDGISLTPGVRDDFPGTGTYSSGGIVSLIASGQDFHLSSDGLLNLEFFESFDDVAGAPDAIFLPGSTLTIHQFPTPGSLAILGITGLAATRRRR